ncbi:MAG: phosphopantothenoylcysteine decarboxylase [Candidatus Omnitrophica bacterium]|nr:phosphopantothenoylcysteine decarboxylase [Candidatus Omnitrophota bacterium]
MSKLKNKSVLITCGPTWVPIDDVRVISNISTGEMGQTLALECKKRGAKVTLIEGPVERRLVSKGINVKPFKYFTDLAKIIRKELKKNYDVIFHAAAVSDYAVNKPSKNKIKSDRSRLTLNLVPLPKLIQSLRKFSPKAFIVGFKLESDMTEKTALESTRGLFKKSFCDLVIANTVRKQKYLGYIVEQDKVLAKGITSRSAMVKKILNTVENKI